MANLSACSTIGGRVMYGVTDAEASPKQALPCNGRENVDGTSTLMVLAEIKPPVLTHVNVDFSSSDEEQEIIEAPAAGLRIRIAALELTALENVEVAIKSGSTTLGTYQGAAIAPNLQVPINLVEAEAFNIQATTDVRITGRVGYYLEAV
jgi:hypothetical protein